MPEEKGKTVEKVAIGVAAALAAIVILALATKVKAALPEVYTCPICGATFATEAELATHMEEVHGEPPQVYTCPICGATFTTEAELAIHMEEVHCSGTLTAILKNVPQETHNDQVDVHITLDIPLVTWGDRFDPYMGSIQAHPAGYGFDKWIATPAEGMELRYDLNEIYRAMDLHPWNDKVRFQAVIAYDMVWWTGERRHEERWISGNYFRPYAGINYEFDLS